MTKSALTSMLVLFGVFASAVTLAGPDQTGAIAVPANRIVGLWSTEAMVGPCGGPQPVQILNTLLFNAGGTVVENPRFPPAGAGGYQRSQALGTWAYDVASKTYSLRLRFDNYVNGVYEGYSIVDRTIGLSDDGSVANGQVTVNRYLGNGTLLGPTICGSATSVRL